MIECSKQSSIQLFKRASDKKIEQISYLLKLRGEDVEVTRIMNDNLKEAILKFKSEVGLPPDDTLSRDLYIALLTNHP